MNPLLVRFQDVGTQSLKSIHFWLGSGEMVGMVIIDGFGLKDLIKILEGEMRPTGHIFLNSKVSVIDGDSRLVPQMTLAENLLVLRKNSKMWKVNHLSIQLEAQRILTEHRIHFSATDRAKHLTFEQRIQVELLKAKISGTKVVVLNGIGNQLSASAYEKISQFIEGLREFGMAFIYMDNFSDPFFNQCSRHYIYNGGTIEKVFYDKRLCRETVQPFVNMKTPRSSISSHAKEPVITFNYEGKAYTLFKGQCLTVLDKEKSNSFKFLKAFDEVASTYTVPENPIENTLYLDQSYMYNLTFGLDKKIGRNILPQKFIYSVAKEFGAEIGNHHRLPTIRGLSKEELLKLVYYRVLLLRTQLVVIRYPFIGMDVQQQQLELDLMARLKERGISLVILSASIGSLKSISEQVVEMEWLLQNVVDIS